MAKDKWGKEDKPVGWNPREHGGMKHDGEKSRPDLIDAAYLLEVGNVSAYGAKKYEEENWRKFDDPQPFLAAAMRHLLAAMEGELINDEDGGAHHLAQVGWNAMAAWSCINKRLGGNWKPNWKKVLGEGE